MQIGLGLWLGTRQIGGFNPAAVLFGAGEQGGWYDPSDISTLFQDTAGTVPVTAAGQTVARINDKSGRGNHLTQATAASRPIYGIEPFGGRRNLLTFTEQFDNAAWAKLNTTITADVTTSPDGTSNADKLTETGTTGLHYAANTSNRTGTFTQSVYAKAAERTSVAFGLALNSSGVVFNLSNGTVTSTGVGWSNSTITPVGNGWYRCSATATLAASWIYISPNTANSYAGTAGSGIFIWGAQLETGSTATAYQCVTDQWNVTEAGVPIVSYVQYDGTDDWFTSPTITPGIDKAQVFAGVRKLSDATQGVIAELSASTAANNGALLLAAPDANTTATYGFDSKGTVQVDAVTSSLVAPLTSVLTGIADISGDNTVIRVNGVQANADTGDQGTGNYLAYPLYVGRRGGTALPFNGRMYQMIVRFGANLDAATIAATETFVNNKTGAYGFAAAPSNYDAIFFGDSRTENGFAPNVNTSGYAANLNNVGLAAQLGPMTGHRLRVGKFANFGIGGGSSIQAAFDPRQAASGSVTTGQWWRGGQNDLPVNSGSSNKSISDAIAHPAGIVVMLMNTNDGPTNWPVNSRTAMTTIINALTAAGKVVVLLNETPRGINSAGALQSDLSAANMALFKDLSDWLSKWAFDSGDVLAKPRVIVIDSCTDFYDPATGANYYNKVGYLHDGLHFTPFASKRLAQMIDNKLSSVWRQYAALPRRRTLPTANGFAAITDTTPYLNSNPIFTPGGPGAVSGTWGSAPTAATVCQGWTIAGGGTISGINLVAEKGVDTDPDGFPVQKLTVTGGSLADLGTATVILQQSFTNIAALTSAGMLSLTSKLRAMARVKIDAGSNLLSSVNVSLTVFADTTAKNLTARTMRTSSFLPLNRVVDMADGEWYDYVTELLDIAEPNMSPTPGNPSSITSMVFTVNMQFDNRTGATATPSAVVRIARAGPYVTAD